jgi:hypothetical protein
MPILTCPADPLDGSQAEIVAAAFSLVFWLYIVTRVGELG